MLKAIWWKTGVEKGRFFRTSELRSIKLRLLDLNKGTGLTSWVEGNTRELAKDGFVIEVDRVMVDGFHILTDAMKEGRGLELECELPAVGGVVKGKGKVLWFKLALNGPSRPFKAGVLLMEMDKHERQHWLKFARGLLD